MEKFVGIVEEEEKVEVEKVVEEEEEEEEEDLQQMMEVEEEEEDFEEGQEMVDLMSCSMQDTYYVTHYVLVELDSTSFHAKSKLQQFTVISN